jgi:putative ABC transport system substrate-binding protein
MTARRNLLEVAVAGAFSLPRWVHAQQPGRSYRLGWFSTTAEAFKEPQALAFSQRLAELGFVEGRNLVVERRNADGNLERMHGVSAELGKLKCDAYFGGGGEVNLAAMTQASPQTPIVFVAVDFDPVLTGDVASLARPGGRMSGVTALQSALPAKRVELLKELAPGVLKVAVLANVDTSAQLALVQGTARRLGLALQIVDMKRPPFNFEAAFTDVARAKAEALLVLGSGLWVPARRIIVESALKARLPTVFHQGHWVDAGGLMSYGFNFPAMWRRGAEMVAEVLRGAKVGDMPMEQPTVYELVVNLKTARSLGLKVPQSLLVRANRVIE